MKARVKETGSVIDVQLKQFTVFNRVVWRYEDEEGMVWTEDDIEFITDNEPGYWEKLKHQAAIAAMPIANSIIDGLHGSKYHRQDGGCLHTIDMFINECATIATALIEKLKEEQK